MHFRLRLYNVKESSSTHSIPVAYRNKAVARRLSNDMPGGSEEGGRVGTSNASDCSLSCNTGARAVIIVTITIAIVMGLCRLFSYCYHEPTTDGQRPKNPPQQPLKPIEQYWTDVEARDEAERKRRKMISLADLPTQPKRTATTAGKRYRVGYVIADSLGRPH